MNLQLLIVSKQLFRWEINGEYLVHALNWRNLERKPKFMWAHDTIHWCWERQFLLKCQNLVKKEAATKAIEEWGHPLSRITHLVFSTSTSDIDMPGADFCLTNPLRLRPSVKRFMMYQPGGTVFCLAKDLAENNKGTRVLVVCSEIMVINFWGPGETHLDSQVCHAMFSDGAGAW